MSHPGDDEACRVYWGHSGCTLLRGHKERDGTEHYDADNDGQPYPGLMFGEDATADEREDM